MKISYSKQARKYLDKLDAKTYSRLSEAIDDLSEGKVTLQGYRTEKTHSASKSPHIE